MHKLLVATTLLLALGVARADAPPGYDFVDFDQGMRLAREQGRHLFVYFGRHGCGWCEKTNKEAFSDAGLKRIYDAHYVLVYVDSESGARLTLPSGERITSAELGARLRVHATPVFLFLEPDGTTILRAPGVQSVDDFLEYDAFVHGGAYRTKRFSEFREERS